MATYTKYKSLEKPLSTERYNVSVANKNNDVIDSELHKLELKNQSQDSLLATKDALNSEISRATARENDIIQDLTAEISRAKSSENELSDHIQNEIDRAIQAETDIKEELENYLPITGGTLSNDKTELLRLENTSQNANTVSMRFKIPQSEKEVMMTVFSDGQFEIWDGLNGTSLFKSSINGIFYRNKNLLIEGNGDSTKNKGVIELLTDINQINGAHRFWDIHNIDAEYAKEIGLETNPGDYHAIVSYFNGDETEYKYGNLFLSTPRWPKEFYYITINKDKIDKGEKKVIADKQIVKQADIIDNIDILLSNTNPGKIVDALIVKEIFQSSSGINAKVLKTLEEIAANTDEENIAGASAVAELNNKLAGFEPILNSAGKITGYKTDIGGADTVFPF